MKVFRILSTGLAALALGYLVAVAMGSMLSGVIFGLVLFLIALYLSWEARSHSRDAGQLEGRRTESGELKVEEAGRLGGAYAGTFGDGSGGVLLDLVAAPNGIEGPARTDPGCSERSRSSGFTSARDFAPGRFRARLGSGSAQPEPLPYP